MMKIGTLCYIEKDNRTLMLHRIKKENDIHKDKWVGLGGKLEHGESPEECIIREVREESGLTISNPTLRGILTFPDFENEHWYVFLFTANEFTGEIRECNEGNLEWIENEKLLDLEMAEGDTLFLEWLKSRGLFSAKFVYDGDRLISYDKVDYLIAGAH